MSNRICGRCKSSVVIPYGKTALFKCQNCSALGEQSNFPEKTVFHQITASPEVLAPLFVREVWTVAEAHIVSRWVSEIVPDIYYESESEAIAATVEKLKEVCDD